MRALNDPGHVVKPSRYHIHIVGHKMRETGRSGPDRVGGAVVDGDRKGIATCCSPKWDATDIVDLQTLNFAIPCNGVVVDSSQGQIVHLAVCSAAVGSE